MEIGTGPAEVSTGLSAMVLRIFSVRARPNAGSQFVQRKPEIPRRQSDPQNRKNVPMKPDVSRFLLALHPRPNGQRCC